MMDEISDEPCINSLLLSRGADLDAGDGSLRAEPRSRATLLAALVGAALAAAGAAFQGLLRHDLADPYLLGTFSGASFGAALSLVLLPAAGFAGHGRTCGKNKTTDVVSEPTVGRSGRSDELCPGPG